MGEFDEESENESGGALRQKLEAALKTNAEKDAVIATYKATDVIKAQGYKYVTPQDLTGVPIDELAAKAAELEGQKQAAASTLLKTALAGSVPAEQLDAEVARLLGGAKTDAAADRVHTVSQIQGLPANTPEVDLNDGPGMIRQFLVG